MAIAAVTAIGGIGIGIAIGIAIGTGDRGITDGTAGFPGDCWAGSQTGAASAASYPLPLNAMPSKPKSWQDKMRAKPAHTVVLDKDFAGVPAGSKLLISCPLEVAEYLKTQVPPGQTRAIQQMRRELAERHGADAACPVSTAIFLRTVAEAAWDELEAGRPVTEVAPFWRVVEPRSPLGRKLRAGSQWIEQQRAAEAGGDVAAGGER